MSKNLLDLASRMTAIAASLQTQTSGISVYVADKVLKHLIDVTPVDTTNAVSNWQIGLGAPVQSEREPYVPGFLGYTAAASKAQAYAAGLAILANKKPGQTIFISNLAPYIVDLNSGTSRQEPSGFVQRAVIIGRETLKTSKLKF